MLFKRMEKIAIHHIVMLKQLVQYASQLFQLLYIIQKTLCNYKYLNAYV